MGCLEMINLRSVSVAERDQVINLVQGIVPEQVNHLMIAKWCVHGNLDTDLSVQLFWGDGAKTLPSVLAQRLVRLLENYGLVSHHIWIEAGIFYTADDKEAK